MNDELRDGVNAKATDPPQVTTIAITGHRSITDPSAISEAIGSVLIELAAAPANQRTITILSPLAEGADRLAVHEVLRLPGGRLCAVLPLAQQDYEQDFATVASLAEFRDLLALSAQVETLPTAGTRADAYLAVGHHVVDDCDIVLAVWDGRPARGVGGTAEVVAYARKCCKPLIIIDSEDPTHIRRERLSGTEEETAP